MACSSVEQDGKFFAVARASKKIKSRPSSQTACPKNDHEKTIN